MRRQQIWAGFIIALSAAIPCFSQTSPQSSPQISSPTTPQVSPPPYSQVRWTEDYSYLKDAANKTDYLDSIKYIPVPIGDDSYLSLGGQARYRYEYFNNSAFGGGSQDETGYSLIRLLLHADLHIGENFRFFVQGKSAMIDNGGIGPNDGPRPVDADELDLEQAFGDLIFPIDSAKLTFRLGRQEMAYGVQRVIGPSDWSNARRAFDGAKVLFQAGKNQLDLFWLRPVDIEKEEFDNGDPNTSFAGLYDTLSLDGLIQAKDASKLEMYGLALNRTNALFAQNPTTPQDEDRYTVGGRFSASPRPFDLDVESAYQFGQYGSGKISAWMFSIVGGYTLHSVELEPRLSLGLDVASGDHNPNNADMQTYNQLFPTAHHYFGYADVIGRQNIIDLHGGIDCVLLENNRFAKKLTFEIEPNFFWREDTADALYGVLAGAAASPGLAGIARPAGGSDAAYVGSELDFLLTWQFNRHVSGYIGYSHFFAGDFLHDTPGPDRDIDFAYAALTYTF